MQVQTLFELFLNTIYKYPIGFKERISRLIDMLIIDLCSIGKLWFHKRFAFICFCVFVVIINIKYPNIYSKFKRERERESSLGRLLYICFAGYFLFFFKTKKNIPKINFFKDLTKNCRTKIQQQKSGVFLNIFQCFGCNNKTNITK